MMLTEPKSMNECLYFSNRYIGEKGVVRAWVYRKDCPKCHKAKMGKPVVKGKVKTRATEYTCPGCNFTEKKVEHEESLILEAKYTCPACGKDGEGSGPYVRKSFKGVQAYLVECSHCSEQIPITKKLKEIKKKR
jgi:ssDNA-binding Zn-finger/Zn-ribbon topoisomerase 1